jgi:hypothetical protein
MAVWGVEMLGQNQAAQWVDSQRILEPGPAVDLPGLSSYYIVTTHVHKTNVLIVDEA